MLLIYSQRASYYLRVAVILDHFALICKIKAQPDGNGRAFRVVFNLRAFSNKAFLNALLLCVLWVYARFGAFHLLQDHLFAGPPCTGPSLLGLPKARGLKRLRCGR